MSTGQASRSGEIRKRISNGFRFKQFTIHDNRCAHKVGTDGTLLGAWANTQGAKRILDIGTGSGLIALMLAQRTKNHALIDAIELSQTDYTQANDNVKHSPWQKKIAVHHISLQGFSPPQKFDCIVSNPPFFNNSFKPPLLNRITPRHTDTLSYSDLILHTKRLLTEDGMLQVILPFTEGLQFIELAQKENLFLNRQWSFRARLEKPIERWLLSFTRQEGVVEQGEIILYEKDEEWSEPYKTLTRDFYLKL